MLSRSRARIALLAYACFLAAVLLWPTPEIPSGSVSAVDRVLGAIGLGGGDAARRAIEFALNVAAFAVLPVLATLAGARWGVLTWTLLGFVSAGCVELVQAVALNGRSGSLRDLAANTLGAMLGAIIVLLIGRRRAEYAPDGVSPP